MQTENFNHHLVKLLFVYSHDRQIIKIYVFNMDVPTPVHSLKMKIHFVGLILSFTSNESFYIERITPRWSQEDESW